METVLEVSFYVGAFVILWAMVGYPLSLKLLRSIYKNKRLIKDYAIVNIKVIHWPSKTDPLALV